MDARIRHRCCIFLEFQYVVCMKLEKIESNLKRVMQSLHNSQTMSTSNRRLGLEPLVPLKTMDEFDAEEEVLLKSATAMEVKVINNNILMFSDLFRKNKYIMVLY